MQLFLKIYANNHFKFSESTIAPESTVILMDEKWINNTNKAFAAADMSTNDLLDFIAWRGTGHKFHELN